jgi:hypothetical protein
LYFIPGVIDLVSNGFHGKAGATSKSTLAIPAQSNSTTEPTAKIVGYVLQDTKCYGFTKSGSYVDEPEKCREWAK